MFQFENERQLFPILAHKAQLSSCSQSAASLPVLQAIETYTRSWLENGMDWLGWAAEVQHAKAEFARLIGAQAADIAALSCVSDLASSVGSALDFPDGHNEIVVGEIDFPSLGHVWLAHERRGAKVVFAAADHGHTISLETYEKIITDRTRLVSVSHVSYYNGFKQNIAAIAALAHAKQALVFVDAYQSVGSMPIDVRRDGIDMLACGAQKFLLGCPGIAFLYMRPGLAEQLKPTNTGWFGRVDPFSFDIKTLDYAPGPRRFDTGTPAMVNAYAARAGMRLLNSLNMADVESHLQQLSAVAREQALKQGLRIASPADPKAKGSNTAFYIRDAHAVEKKLAHDGFIVSARNDVIRVAPHFYNTEEEVACATKALADHA